MMDCDLAGGRGRCAWCIGGGGSSVDFDDGGPTWAKVLVDDLVVTVVFVFVVVDVDRACGTRLARRGRETVRMGESCLCRRGGEGEDDRENAFYFWRRER